LLNPAYVKAHGQGQGQRSKTDRVDARLIADYLRTHDCEPWAPLPAELEQLRELMRLYADVTALAASMAQRKESLRTSLAAKLQAEVTASLQQFAKQILQTAQAQARQHPSLAQPIRCLRSIKGIGPVTALTLTAELPRHRAARSVAGWAGVTPRQFVSGDTVYKRPKVCKQGSDYVRHVLYWPAITALRFNPAMQAFGQRLQQRGLNKLQIIGAAMHKLLRWAVGVINSEKSFDLSFHATT
jgi:transposase